MTGILLWSCWSFVLLSEARTQAGSAWSSDNHEKPSIYQKGVYLLPLNAAKRRWLRRGLAGTKTGCSAKHPVLSFLKLHESDQLFSICLSARPSSCRRASVCGCGKEHASRGCGGSHQGLTGVCALLPALHYSETVQDLVEPFPFSYSSFSFPSLSSSSSFSKCSVVQSSLQSNQKAPEKLTLSGQTLVP